MGKWGEADAKGTYADGKQLTHVASGAGTP
jgi:hypothetical protein